VAAARRAGLDLSGCRPRALTRDDLGAAVVVTVCDRAREELEPGEGWLHWSIADPVEAGSRRAFDEALAELEARISVVTSGPREARPS
jgi:ArsR family transcriptional regulator, arsenate/arsenite/antimonite-responsive transcriptional repressor / arsenate reductase (thioredoxin)